VQQFVGLPNWYCDFCFLAQKQEEAQSEEMEVESGRMRKGKEGVGGAKDELPGIRIHERRKQQC